VNLRYVGSPYQTSLSEAGQTKFFYLLRRDASGLGLHRDARDSGGERTLDSAGGQARWGGWSELERIPLDIGQKYFKASDVFICARLPLDLLSTSLICLKCKCCLLVVTSRPPRSARLSN